MSIAVRQDGTVWWWGVRGTGNPQLGGNPVPRQVPGIYNAADVVAGYNHSAALSCDGYVYTWGTNWDGQWGVGTRANSSRTEAVRVPSLSGITSIASSRHHLLALDGTGNVWGWGRNPFDGTSPSAVYSTPVRATAFRSGSPVAHMASNERTSLFLRADGTLWFARGDGHRYGSLNLGESEPQRPPGSHPFTDVRNHWANNRGYIQFVYNNGLMSGMTRTSFAPNVPLTRGMVVTILWRMSGEAAAPSNHNPFADVRNGRFYTNAVLWAFHNNIVTGMTPDRFAPSENITRSQFAAMLHRYAEYRGLSPDVPHTHELERYTDQRLIQAFAREPMRWANYNGLITGNTPTTLNPRGTATRAECAAILQRFMTEFNLTV